MPHIVPQEIRLVEALPVSVEPHHLDHVLNALPSKWCSLASVLSPWACTPHLAPLNWKGTKMVGHNGEHYCRISPKFYGKRFYPTFISCFATTNSVSLRVTKMVFQNKTKMGTVSPKGCDKGDCGGMETAPITFMWHLKCSPLWILPKFSLF